MSAQYTVMDKTTGDLFSGFDAEGNPTWTPNKSEARSVGTRLHAQAQASLFVAMGLRVQLKPEAL